MSSLSNIGKYLLLWFGILHFTFLTTDCAYPRTCTQCLQDNTCKPPACSCCGDRMPLVKRRDVPQMVFFTFDDAITPPVATFYRQLFNSTRKNPNGCPIKMTLFVSHANTVYSLVREFYLKGMEIGVHSVSHSHPNTSTFKTEAKTQKENIARYARVPLSEIKGWRSPFLEPLGDVQPDALQSLDYTYDATLTISKRKRENPALPFTLDYGWPYDCKIKPCPAGRHRGFWEVPVVSLMDYLEKFDCVYVDGCHSPPPNEEAAFKFLVDNFRKYYDGNRAPFGINMHASWFYYPDRLRAMDRFIQLLSTMDDVYITSTSQMIEWLKKPTPLSEIKQFEPWSCSQSREISRRRHRQRSHVSTVEKKRTEVQRFGKLKKARKDMVNAQRARQQQEAEQRRQQRVRQNIIQQSAQLGKTRARIGKPKIITVNAGKQNSNLNKERQRWNQRKQLRRPIINMLQSADRNTRPSISWQKTLRHQALRQQFNRKKAPRPNFTWTESSQPKPKNRKESKSRLSLNKRMQIMIEKTRKLIEAEQRRLGDRKKQGNVVLSKEQIILEEQRRKYIQHQINRLKIFAKNNLKEGKLITSSPKQVKVQGRTNIPQIIPKKVPTASMKKKNQLQRRGKISKIVSKQMSELMPQTEVQILSPTISTTFQSGAQTAPQSVRITSSSNRIHGQGREQKSHILPQNVPMTLLDRAHSSLQLNVHSNGQKQPPKIVPVNNHRKVRVTNYFRISDQPRDIQRNNAPQIQEFVEQGVQIQRIQKRIFKSKSSKDIKTETKNRSKLDVLSPRLSVLSSWPKPEEIIVSSTTFSPIDVATAVNNDVNYVQTTLATNSNKDNRLFEAITSGPLTTLSQQTPGPLNTVSRESSKWSAQATTPDQNAFLYSGSGVPLVNVVTVTTDVFTQPESTTTTSSTLPPTTELITTSTMAPTTSSTATPTTQSTTTPTTAPPTVLPAPRQLILFAAAPIRTDRPLSETKPNIYRNFLPIQNGNNKEEKTSSFNVKVKQVEINPSGILEPLIAPEIPFDICAVGVNCFAPHCSCKSNKPPGGLTQSQVPQIVYITIEGRVKFLTFSKTRSLFNGQRINPNGCRIRGTIFAKGGERSYRLAQLLNKDGIELGISDSAAFSPQFVDKILSSKKTMVRNTDIPETEIRGWRSENRQPLSDRGFQFLSNNTMYDSSMVTTTKTWPFTLDYGWQESCKGKLCPKRGHAGVWEVPIVPITSPTTQESCVNTDGCKVQPSSIDETFDLLVKNFNSHYKNNKTPFGIHLKQAWFQWHSYHNLAGLGRFLDYILHKKDVYVVSVSQILDWMKSPTSLEKLNTFKPWQCR